jgi:hypothetical protein
LPLEAKGEEVLVGKSLTTDLVLRNPETDDTDADIIKVFWRKWERVQANSSI